MLQLLLILIPLVGGYFCRRLPISQVLLSRSMNMCVFIILFVMGYNFGQHSSSIFPEALQLLKEVTTFTIFLLFFNFISIYLIFKSENRLHVSRYNLNENHPGFLSYASISCQYLFYVVAGIASGYFLKWNLIYLDAIISFLLFFILFIIGYQLNQQAVPLKNILANKLGIYISIVIVISSLFAGMIAAKILSLDVNRGLMLASGFGWYTMSGILSESLSTHHMGTASFLIDFMREITAILLIPAFGSKHPMPLLGYCGATALDFTLPIIKVNLGKEIVPIAITSGMVLTILVPILIPLVSMI